MRKTNAHRIILHEYISLIIIFLIYFIDYSGTCRNGVPGTQGFSHPDSPFVEVHLCGTRNLLHFFLPNFQRFPVSTGPVSTGPVCGGSTVLCSFIYYIIYLHTKKYRIQLPILQKYKKSQIFTSSRVSSGIFESPSTILLSCSMLFLGPIVR